MDSLKLELLKNKQEHAQSAIASQEVREHLAGFIRSKRQGSSYQINNIHLPPGHHHLSHIGGGSQVNNGGGNNSYVSHYVANLINEEPQDEDHPLRKTASMPTMHIPYKAQSLSRRRQMERRTTMSPLMGRKCKPKRQLLHSNDSSSTEYSSNPCIIQSTRTTARSLSQSSSPPPPLHQTTTIQMVTANDTNLSNHQIPLTSSNMISTIKNSTATATTAPPLSAASCQQSSSNSTPTPNSSQAIKLSSIFTNKELENLQNNLKNSLYFSTAPHSSSSSLNHQTPQKSSLSNGSCSISNNYNTNNNNNDSQLDQNALRHQQHLKVNEAIRKTVIQRASNRGRMACGGSLDMEGTLAAGGVSGETGVATKGSNTSGGFGEELRQWSLDGADLRINATLNKLAGTTMSGGSFYRDFHKFRMATKKDAPTSMRPQSPNSSISMGLPSGQIATSIPQHQPPPTHNNLNPTNNPTRKIPGLITNVNVKQYSSSSSSTSSLLSQQDSLEESSSQAIDLSSSSEASRRHQQSSASMFAPVNVHRSQLASQLINCTSNTTAAPSIANHQYQKVLQESFNQLQLCQSQEGLNNYLLPSQQQQSQQQPAPSQHHTIHRGESSTATCHHHTPSLVNTSKMASSLDATNNQHQQLLVSLSKQFNLSSSAQNLISIQDRHFHHNLQSQNQQLQLQQQQHQYQSGILHQQNTTQLGPIMAHQQQHDLNQLMLAYKNLVQSPESGGQQTGHLSSAILTKITNLPEAYKSGLWSHLIQHQQQQQHQQQKQQQHFQTFNTMAGVSGISGGESNKMTSSLAYHHRHHYHHYDQQGQGLDQKSILFPRTLSSPLLASEASMNVDTSPAYQQQRDQMMCCESLQQTDIELKPSRIDSNVSARDEIRGGDPTIGMIIDSVDDRILEQTTSKQFPITDNNR